MAQKKRDPFCIPTDQLVLLVERMQRYEPEAAQRTESADGKKQELKRAMKQENHQRETEEVVLTPETVKQLPKKQAEVMLLHYGNHVEVKENAKILNVPEGTVKSRLYYGRKKTQGNFNS